jgi:hypothetical protein
MGSDIELKPDERICPACNGLGTCASDEKVWTFEGWKWQRKEGQLCWLCLGAKKIKKDQFGRGTRGPRRRRR